MPRLYSPSLPSTPMFGRALAIPVPMPLSRSHSRSATIPARMILLFLATIAFFGFVLHPASPAKSVLPASFRGYEAEDHELVTESHSAGGAWSWFDENKNRETILVTGGAGQLGEFSLLSQGLTRSSSSSMEHLADVLFRPSISTHLAGTL